MDEREGKIDVVLLDIMMPFGDGSSLSPSETDYGSSTGFAVARILQKKYPTLPLLAMSARSDKEITGWFTEYGAGYLDKPFDHAPASPCQAGV